MQEAIDKWQLALREDDRIKLGVDYAVARKYGELHVYCNAVFREAIVEKAAVFGLDVTSIETWERHEPKSLEPYDQGWNDAIDAALERLRAHQIDWLGNTFGETERKIAQLVESLRRPR